MKYAWLAGSTDRTVLVFVQDSSSTTGAGLPGLVAADLNARVIRVETDNDVTIAAITLSDLTTLTDAHSDGGWLEIDATNAPGWYRFDIPDAVLAAGAWTAGISIIDAGANDVAPVTIEIQLDPAPVNVVAEAVGMFLKGDSLRHTNVDTSEIADVIVTDTP